jgi:hypothetical protein
VRAGALIPGLLLALLLAPPALAGADLWSQADGLRNDDGYADASTWRQAQVRALVSDMVREIDAGALPASARRRAQAAGLVLEEREGWVVLHSLPEAADGFYAFRKGAQGAPQLVLEAPHAWYDLNTGRISCALFEAGYGRALLLNSAQRKAPVGSDEALGADVAHRAGSVYQAAHLGVVDALEDPLVVQLHGFGAGHGDYAAVVSQGADDPSEAWLSDTIMALEPLLGSYGSLVPGETVPKLSGRSNVQGQAATASSRFLHLELSRDVRRALVASAELQQRFGDILSEIARNP